MCSKHGRADFAIELEIGLEPGGMNMIRRMLAVLLCVGFVVSGSLLTGCEPDTPKERMEKNLEDAQESLGDAAKDLGEVVEDAAKDAGETMEGMAEEAGEAVEEAGEAVEDAANQ